MQRTAGTSSIEGFLIDWVRTQPVPDPRLPVSWLSRSEKAAELQQIQRRMAQDSARQAELILGMAEDTPDRFDPPPNSPGAKKRGWAVGHELPGVSEFFTAELSMVLNCGRGTASYLTHRAWTYRESLPATFAALRAAEIDERRARELFDVLQHAAPQIARQVEAAVLPEATELTLGKLRRRALELLLELDADAADERRRQAEKTSDVHLQPGQDGMASLGADLPADEAAEAVDLIDQLARMAKADGDRRPIGQLRAAIFSLLLRRPADSGLPAVTADLTITAALAALEGSDSEPGDVNGLAITAGHLRALLRRIGALGLTTPEGGSLTFALTDEHRRLLATLTQRELRRLARRGCPTHPHGDCGCPILDRPPATDAYEPTDRQRRYVKTRDRTCRFPNCGQRVGWADLDHVIPHARGGATDCANLCCLCRSHHRLKTHARGWRFQMDDDGTLHVTTPSGITRTTRPPGLRPPPEETGPPPPTAMPAPPLAPPDDEPPPF